MKDLVILAADKDIEFTLKGLLTRNQSLDIQDISRTYDIFVHPQRDPGCYKQCVDFLRPFIKEYKYALVTFDHDGSGQEEKSRADIEAELELHLSLSGWENRSYVIVLEPEIESWVWSDSPHVEKILGWENCNPNLKIWLNQNKYLNDEEIKPRRPKEAMQDAMRKVRKARSPLFTSNSPKRLALETILMNHF